jgi:GxxExxY protein
VECGEIPGVRSFEPPVDIDRLARRVIGAAIEVHRALGPGFLESAYEEALCIELALREIPFARQMAVDLRYKAVSIGTARLDLLVDRRLVVELKVVDDFAPIHVAQVLSYLKATQLPLGLLINFNVAKLRQGLKRIALTPNNPLALLAALAVSGPS